MDFILASASPRRVQLLSLLGLIPLQVIPANIDETPLRGELPLVYVKRIACAKAKAISTRWPGVKILSADTIVVLGKRILPKAEDAKTARECLALISGRRHRVMTCICVIDRAGKLRSKTVTTVVQCSRLSPEMIEDYIASGEWNGKAGGYAIQGKAAAWIPFIAGSHSNVVGLPLHETAKLLGQ